MPAALSPPALNPWPAQLTQCPAHLLFTGGDGLQQPHPVLSFPAGSERDGEDLVTWPGRGWGPCLTSPTGSHTISSHVSPCCPQSWAATGQRTREIHTPQCSGGFNKTVLRESFPQACNCLFFMHTCGKLAGTERRGGWGREELPTQEPAAPLVACKFKSGQRPASNLL